MKIELITQEEYEKLLEIYKSNPKLTLENVGYEYIKGLTVEDTVKIKEVEEILKKSILGFKEFSNFRHKTGEIQLRIQYNYSADDPNPRALPFTGVGYLYIEELLNGFRKDKD